MTGDDVRAEKVRTLYRQTAPVLVTNLVNSAIVSVVLWDSAPRVLVIGWMALMCTVVIARVVVHRSYRRTSPPPADAKLWGRRFTVGSATAGVLWGGAGFLLLERASDLSQLLVTFVIGGMCAAAAGTIACYLPAFETFVFSALAPLALRMMLFDDSTHAIMAAMIAIYAVALSFVARVNNRVLSEAFALRFENERLLKKLSLTQSRLEDTNRTLEQRVAERTEELRRQAESLRDAQRMEAVGRLAGGVAHDFNNLLTIILANLSDIMQYRVVDGEFGPALNEMREAATKGADLVRQLLMFSRRQRTSPKVLDLNTVVQTMDKLLRRLLGDSITLRVVLQNSPVLVQLDQTQIEQVIVNLVANARDASTSGGVVTIETRTDVTTEPLDGLEAGTYAVLSVSDTGRGMDSETRQLIFDPFFTTKDVGKGTGLGLATVHGIVEQSCGHIRVTSKVDHGSTFCIYLPPATTPSNKSVSPLGAREQSWAAQDLPDDVRQATVLLVEDEPTVRNVTERILKREGFRVLVAESAERAFTIAGEQGKPIELLITDVVMAGMGGPELARHLRAGRPQMRTLLISGYSRDQAIPKDDPEGGTMFLAKPFTSDVLISKVKEMFATPPCSGRPPG